MGTPDTITFLLVRHGQTEWNRQERFRGRAPVPLDEIGHHQAAQVAARLARLCGPGGRYPAPLAVGHSPMVRTTQTAEQIAAALGAPLRPLDDLADLDYGAWQGWTHAEARAADPDAYARWRADPTHVAPPNGETMGALQARVVGVLQECVRASQAGQSWVLVGHEITWRAIFCWALGVDLTHREQFGQDPTGLSIFTLAPGLQAPGVLGVINDTAHLEGGPV